VTAESWGVVLVVLAAILVGAAIPALVQARVTLRALEKTLQRSGPRLDQALEAATGAVGKVDRLVVRLEEGGRIEQLVDGVAAVSRVVGQLRDTIRVASAVGAAVGPAVVAAIHAFREEPAPAPPRPTQTAEAVEPAQPVPERQATT
jgi:hypothetical protein